MNRKLTLQSFASAYGKWIVLFALPLVVNVVLWMAYVAPQTQRLDTAKRKDAMLTLVPRVETLLKDSRNAIVAWERSGLRGGDATAALQALRRLADKHRVQLGELASNRAGARGGRDRSAQTPTVKVEATGRYSRLARWLSAVERQAGLQVESWSIVPDGDELLLTAEVTAIMKDS